MALKTILVHLANDEDHVGRMEVAKGLARAYDAFLTALFITHPGDTLKHIPGRGVSPVFLEEAFESANRRARELEGEFSDYCTRENIPHEWVVADSEHLETIARHAHAADLVIVTRPTDQNLEDRVRIRMAEELVLSSGLPILALPPGFGGEWLPKHVLIAWKPTREAVRAVRDALPLIETADKVIVASIKPSAEDAVSTLEVMQYLRRQGANVESIDMPEKDSVADTLLAIAESHECNLIVAGAYGHSRLREVFLGGVTRGLMRHSTVPLLLSH